MPHRLPRYVTAERDRHGKVRFYFRRDKSSARIPLPAPVGSDAFMSAYVTALSGDLQARAEKAAAPTEHVRSIRKLIRSYTASGKFKALRETTKAGYRSRLKLIEESGHAHRSVDGLTPDRIRRAFLDPLADRPGQALSVLKILRILIAHAIKDLRWISTDPSEGIERPKTQEIRSWTEEEIDRFEAKWAIGTKQRLAFALHLYTGQRRSDIHRIRWTDVSGDAIAFTQQKTGVKLLVPIHPELRAVLAVAERRHVVMLVTEFGKPFTVDGFSNFMREAIRDAGLPLDCQPHGLRKATGRRLAEGGCTPHEIMAILGHKTLAEVERYTREADKKRLGVSAILKMSGGQKANKIPEPKIVGSGKSEKA